MFSKKGLLFFTALALLAFVGQASASPNANAVLSVDIDASDNKMNDGNTSGSAVSGTDVVIEIFISGLAGPIVGGVVAFDTDKLTIKSVTPAAGFFALGTTANTVSLGAVPSGTLTNDYFGTITLSPTVGVTASTEFTVGVSVNDLAAAANINARDNITAAMPLSFNEPTSGEFAGLQLHLDTQVETPATHNSTLTIPEQKAGDTIQLQLFVPMAAGKQTYGYEIELDLPDKTFSNYIGSISGTDFTGAFLLPTPGRPILSALLISTPVIPANGYLGQIDLQVINILEAETTLIVKTASMASLNRQQDPLDVSNAVITFTVISNPGDFDGDLDVDFADFLAFTGVLGLSSSDTNYDARMDMNDDGIINFADFLAFVGVFGSRYDQPIVDQTFDLPGGSLEDFSFTVNTNVQQSVILQGEFSVENGTVQMAVMGESEYQTWLEGGTPVVLYSPGETSGETFRLSIVDSDTYYIVFRNSGANAVKVKVKIFLF